MINAAIAGANDSLRGLKENVIIGHLIPAGAGMKSYRNVKLFDDKTDDLDAYVQTLIEQRKLEEQAQAEYDQESPGEEVPATVAADETT